MVGKSLAKFLEKMALKEGASGNPYLNISKNLVLRLEDFHPEGEAWRLFNTTSKKPLGDFLVDVGGRHPNAVMSRAEIYDGARNKGYGSKVYQALTDHYGKIVSDKGSTSPQAFAVYDKLGGKELSKAEKISPLLNKDGERRMMLKSNKKSEYLKLFDDED